MKYENVYYKIMVLTRTEMLDPPLLLILSPIGISNSTLFWETNAKGKSTNTYINVSSYCNVIYYFLYFNKS